MYDLYRQAGAEPALTKFREQAFADADRQILARAPKNDANTAYWFEHELRQYPAAGLDMDALTRHAGKIVLTVGREGRGYPAHEVNVMLGAKLGREVIELPGGHIGYVAHPAEFARELARALARTGHEAKT